VRHLALTVVAFPWAIRTMFYGSVICHGVTPP
jgi:hypothetical protein